MKKAVLSTMAIAAFTLCQAQTEELKIEVFKTVDADGKVRPDTVLVLKPGEETPKGWNKRVMYKNEKGFEVSKDGKYIFFFSEDAETGELFRDSALVKEE